MNKSFKINKIFVILLFLLCNKNCFSQNFVIDTVNSDDGTFGIGYKCISIKYINGENPKIGKWNYYYTNGNKKSTYFYWLDTISFSSLFIGNLDFSKTINFFEKDFEIFKYYSSYEQWVQVYSEKLSLDEIAYVAIFIDKPIDCWYINGNIKEKTFFYNETNKVVHKTFFEDGNTEAMVSYVKGVISGEKAYYDENNNGYWHEIYFMGVLKEKYFEKCNKKIL